MEYRFVAKGTHCNICGRIAKTPKVRMIVNKGLLNSQLGTFICPACVYKMGSLIVKNREQQLESKEKDK